MWRPVTLSGNRWSLSATKGVDRWSSPTELGLQACLAFFLSKPGFFLGFPLFIDVETV